MSCEIYDISSRFDSGRAQREEAERKEKQRALHFAIQEARAARRRRRIIAAGVFLFVFLMGVASWL